MGGHHEAGEAAAGTQVDHPRSRRAAGSQAAGDGAESLGVTDLGLERPGSEKSRGPGLGQDLVQCGGGVAPFVGAGHRRCVSPPAR